MNFILAKLKRPGYVHPKFNIWCGATCTFEGIWPAAELAKEEAEYASGVVSESGDVTPHPLTWVEVERDCFEFKSYRPRGYHARHIYKAAYPTQADFDNRAPGSGLWLLFDHSDPPPESEP